MSKIRQNFSKRLSALREKKKVKSSEIASALGMSPENYLRLEKGNQSCRYETIVQLAIFLDTSIDELMGLSTSTANLGQREELLISHYQELNTEQKLGVEQIVRAIYLCRPNIEFLSAISSLISAQKK